MLVGDTGFEPVTSSVSRKRATTAPIARDDSKVPRGSFEQSRWRRDLNPCRRICSPLPRLSATPPRRGPATLLRADDEARTRDLNLGKVALYQLSYVRLQLPGPGFSARAVRARRTVADIGSTANSGVATRVRSPCRPSL